MNETKLPMGRKGKVIKYAELLLCLIFAVTGSFFCQPAEFLLWYVLVFCAYTDMRTSQVYIFPLRLCIVCEFVMLVVKYGLCSKTYIEIAGCGAVIIFLWLVRVYARGDMEIFLMLVVAAVLRGEGAAGYAFRLMSTSAALFVGLYSVYFVIHNMYRKLNGEKIIIIKKAPMVPSIALAFLICCMYG